MRYTYADLILNTLSNIPHMYASTCRHKYYEEVQPDLMCDWLTLASGYMSLEL
jgi:hypothetical protein